MQIIRTTSIWQKLIVFTILKSYWKNISYIDIQLMTRKILSTIDQIYTQIGFQCPIMSPSYGIGISWFQYSSLNPGRHTILHIDKLYFSREVNLVIIQIWNNFLPEPYVSSCVYSVSPAWIWNMKYPKAIWSHKRKWP